MADSLPAWLLPTERPPMRGPVREPNARHRRETLLAEAVDVAAQREDNRRMRADATARQLAGSKKSAAAKRARVIADALARGESLLERKRRMHREAAKKRAAFLAGLDSGVSRNG